MKKVIYTIVSYNYLHYALTVRESFFAHNDNYEFIIFIADRISNKYLLKYMQQIINQDIDIRFIDVLREDFDSHILDDMLQKYNVMELNTAVKPFIMKYFFNRGYDRAIYIDPDIKFYQPITKIDSLLNEHDVIMTPHMLKPYPNDGKEQKLQTIMCAGIYNFGFIAIRNTQNGNNLVDFWAENLFDKCYNQPKVGLFTDQKWGDWFPALFEKVYILKDYGHNAAYWNIHERVITKRDGIWYANDDKLVFFHFSGLNRKNIEPISKHQTRYTMSDRKPDLRELFTEYVSCINAKNADFLANSSYYYNYIPLSGVRIKDEIREKFYSKFVNTNAYIYKGCFKSIRKTLKRYYIKISELNKLYFFKWLLLHFYSPIKSKPFGVNIVGYINEMHSIGEVARCFIEKLHCSGIPFSIYEVISGAKKIQEKEQKKYKHYLCQNSPYSINIIFINADQIPMVMKKHPEVFEDKYNIANWYWEFESGFDKFAIAQNYVNEVFVSTNHTLSGIKNSVNADFKVSKFDFPFVFNKKGILPVSQIREKYSIGEKDITFFFNFDYNSSYERKNPEAILLSFANAFCNENNVKLVVKTTNAKNFEEKKDSFNSLVKKLNLEEKVIVIDEFLSKTEMLSLINACDVYVSLHRAEGFGMGLCEAMSLAKPCIASAYSGNMEFMTKENSLLVDAPKVKATINFPHYSDVKEWAEPDINQAAKYMKELYTNKELREKIGQKAKQDIQEKYSQVQFNKQMYDFIFASILEIRKI